MRRTHRHSEKKTTTTTTITENIDYCYYWRRLSFSVLPVGTAAAAAAAVRHQCTFTAYTTRDTWTIECVPSLVSRKRNAECWLLLVHTTCSAACILNAENCVRVIYLCLALNARRELRGVQCVRSVRGLGIARAQCTRTQACVSFRYVLTYIWNIFQSSTNINGLNQRIPHYNNLR